MILRTNLFLREIKDGPSRRRWIWAGSFFPIFPWKSLNGLKKILSLNTILRTEKKRKKRKKQPARNRWHGKIMLMTNNQAPMINERAGSRSRLGGRCPFRLGVR